MTSASRRHGARAPGYLAGACDCTALRKASRRISQLYDAALAPSGLKTTQRAILAQIDRTQPTTVGALAQALVMDPGALAHTLKPLLRDALVEMAVDLDDRRNRWVTLGAVGRAKLAETEPLWADAQRRFDNALSPAQAQTLREALQLLVSQDFLQSFGETMGTEGRRARPARAPRTER